MDVATNSRRITRDDLQAAYTQLLGEGEATARSVVPQVVVVVGAVAIAAVAIAFAAGRRRGRRQASVIVRRV